MHFRGPQAHLDTTEEPALSEVEGCPDTNLRRPPPLVSTQKRTEVEALALSGQARANPCSCRLRIPFGDEVADLLIRVCEYILRRKEDDAHVARVRLLPEARPVYDQDV